ncbi:MAG TPA: sigma factor [Lentisphaeria bacterium]|nr:sigma factor [Lentisphaeria bacterium]
MLDYITLAAGIKASQLAAHYPHLAPYRDDIRQDIITHALDSWKHYDPSKSSPRTYLSRVIANHAATIARRPAPPAEFFQTAPEKKGTGWLFAFNDAIGTLPPTTQLIAKLIMEGYQRRDACRIAGVSIGELYRVHFPALRDALKDFRDV